MPGLQNIADPREKISGPNMPVALISQALHAFRLSCFSGKTRAHTFDAENFAYAKKLVGEYIF